MVFIVHHMIVSIIGIIMGMLDNVFSRTNGNEKYYAWVLLMVLFLIPVAGVDHQAIINLNIETLDMESAIDTVGIVGTAGINGIGEPDTSITFVHVILVIWIIGICIITLMAVVNQLRLKRYILRCGKMIFEEKNEKILAGKEFSELKFVKVPMFKSPALIGVFNPIVLLPEGLDYTEDEFEVVVMHEYYHYKRKDNLIKFVINLVAVIFWFNPLIHLFKKITLRYCELSCDEYVLSRRDRQAKLSYFNAMVKTAAYDMKYKKYLASHLILGNDKIFKERIEKITMDKQGRTGFPLIVMVLSLVLAMNVMVGCNPVTKESEPKSTEIENVEISLPENEEVEVVIDYNTVDSFEYTHIISYDTWDEAKNNYQESMYYQNDFDGNTFEGNLKCVEANRVGKSDIFDVSFVGILKRKIK